MESKIGIVAQKLPVVERCVSGLLRIQSILAEPEKFYDQRENVGGWIRKIRPQQKNIFIELTDGSSAKGLQIVVDSTISNFAALSEQNITACLRVTGKLVKSPAKGQLIEMVVNSLEDKIEIVGINSDAGHYPIQGVNLPLEFIRKYLHLRPRTNFISSVMRTRSKLSMAIHTFFQELGFCYIHTPIITSSDCEGAGEMFQVTTIINGKGVKEIPVEKESSNVINYKEDFFEKPVFLTVSGQLAVENFACALTNVYTFGPTFRAEYSKTTRHLSEFWMIEPEICFAGLEELFDLIENFVKFCINYSLKNCFEDLEFFNGLHQLEKEKPAKEPKPQKKPKPQKDKNDEENQQTSEPTEEKEEPKKTEAKPQNCSRFDDLIVYLKDIAESKFARLSYTEAIEYLIGIEKSGEHKFEVTPFWGLDLSSEHERYLSEKKVKGPVFLYNYPKEIKSFYMRLNSDGKTVQNTDLILPYIGEVVGGSVREERLEQLMEAYKRVGLKPEDYEFYSDLRRYGTVPHAGFGVGFERLIMFITGIKNIRDTIPYPRESGSCDC